MSDLIGYHKKYNNQDKMTQTRKNTNNNNPPTFPKRNEFNKYGRIASPSRKRLFKMFRRKDQNMKSQYAPSPLSPLIESQAPNVSLVPKSIFVPKNEQQHQQQPISSGFKLQRQGSEISGISCDLASVAVDCKSSTRTKSRSIMTSTVPGLKEENLVDTDSDGTSLHGKNNKAINLTFGTVLNSLLRKFCKGWNESHKRINLMSSSSAYVSSLILNDTHTGVNHEDTNLIEIKFFRSIIQSTWANNSTIANPQNRMNKSQFYSSLLIIHIHLTTEISSWFLSSILSSLGILPPAPQPPSYDCASLLFDEFVNTSMSPSNCNQINNTKSYENGKASINTKMAFARTCMATMNVVAEEEQLLTKEQYTKAISILTSPFLVQMAILDRKSVV